MKAGADAGRGELLFSTAIIRDAATGSPADISAADSRRRLHTLELSSGTEGKEGKEPQKKRLWHICFSPA